MAAIISDKFRIYNAQRFLNALGDDYYDNTLALQVGPEVEASRMYFFVGRPQRWDAYLEIYNANNTAFAVNDFVYVGSSFGAASFKGSVKRVNENSLIIANIGPLLSSAPILGDTLKGWNGTANTGAEALTGVYRYGNEEIAPVPFDNQKEKYDIYDDLIAAKRITTQYARSVIRRYNWNLSTNTVFDMWKPDYSATTDGFQTGKLTATGASSLYEGKYYVMNSNYEVFKCLYNGQSPAYPSTTVQTSRQATYEPTTTPGAGLGTYSAGIYKEPTGSGEYIWKYMYTVTTDDVLKFVSTDFIPIALKTNASRIATEGIAVDGSIEVTLVADAGANLPNGTLYAPVIGDGSGAIVQIIVSGGTITKAVMQAKGSGYTYGTVPLVNGTGSGATAYGLFTSATLTTGAVNTVGPTTRGALEPIISPQGGHGSNMEQELNGKRVMLNVRLTYDEGSGDFPVDNDFRRIGIIKDPLLPGTTTLATADTLSGLSAIKINGATAGYQADEIISQTVTGGIAYGTVVSWTLDAGSTNGNGVLKYIQNPENHKNNGVVRSFISNGANPVVGTSSGASGTVNTTYANTTLGSTFTGGLASPEIKNNSGEVIYIENRRTITRAPDQIEDIKLVIEF
jgi:hypothetical protein